MRDELKSLKMLEAIIETSYDGIYITDGNAVTILANKSYERITGLKADNIIGRNMAELVKSGIISNSATLMVLKSHEPATIYQQFNTGKSAIVTATPFFDEKGIIQMVVTNVRDITDIENLKEKVKISNDENLKYKSIIEELRNQIVNDEYIVAEDEKMLNLLLTAKRVAKVDTTVLITGETGSGKEVLAKYIYNNSSRKDKPFIKINCGAIPESLMESEFFGYVDGAFTGAAKGGKLGLFEVANSGTLLLDEIGELPMPMQVKLLRVLQDGEVDKLGSSKSIKVDVRIIAATNKNLEDMVNKETFREDLYYRLNVVPLKIPPLRERRSSIIPTVEYYLNIFNKKYSIHKKFSREALKYLFEYDWPGNIRELRNSVERLTITTLGDTITMDDIPRNISDSIYKSDKREVLTTLSEAVERIEKEMILNAYERHGNVRGAARELGIDASTFVRKRKKYI
jgi:PAS domain S-box-containing protein